jgi:hypothetical protein
MRSSLGFEPAVPEVCASPKPRMNRSSRAMIDCREILHWRAVPAPELWDARGNCLKDMIF